MMKKILVTVVMILCVLTFNVDTFAATHKKIDKNINNSDIALTMGLNKKKFFEISKLSNKKEMIMDYAAIEPDKVNDNVKAYYYDVVDFDNNFIRYIEWYKKVDGVWVNFKEEKGEGIKFSETKVKYDLFTSIEYNIKNATITDDLVDVDAAIKLNNNGQNGYYKKETYYVQENLSLRQVLVYGTKYNETIANGFQKATTIIYDATDTEFKTVTNVNHKDGKPISMKATTYLDNKKLYLISVEKYKDSFKYSNPFDLWSEEVKYYEYNKKQNLIYYNKEGYEYGSYVKYYVRNKHEKIVAEKMVKSDYDDEEREYTLKNKYDAKGKKTHHIKYKYKNDKIISRTEYLYNSKGKVKIKYFTTYKKGKKLKTTKYLYNIKGKITKKYTVKHRSDFNTDLINYHEYGIVYEIMEDDWFFYDNKLTKKDKRWIVAILIFFSFNKILI